MSPIPFGRRLGRRYPCPSCDKTFVLEKHDQMFCSTRCKRIAKNRRSADSSWRRRLALSSRLQIDKIDAYSVRVLGFKKGETPAEYGSAGWEERCRREWALSQKLATMEAAAQTEADREELAAARGQK